MIQKMLTPWWINAANTIIALTFTFTTGNYMYIFLSFQMSMLINALELIAMAISVRK